MEDVLNGILHRILYVVSLAYTHEWFVPFVLLPIMLVVAGILHTRARRETAPFVTAATARIDALKAALGGYRHG
ncbi:MAG: hypothetical protein IM649_03040 [Phenylobacterium sp.]|nr:hypothetical protein [Phenylobacterium sp.]